ncbi:hypothetical protein BT93_L3421 [Corymbia citriodora subsp. variegata]|uniref:Uncharacterized protein n=1 Tax=Corymbia citriodora subsp. variegata TaxID=360336 RepID=A0A8T0CHC0_CORYI|nr:hypothetical protein BT93_L3421 [Corymbia citriodora subsp. variegata]
MNRETLSAINGISKLHFCNVSIKMKQSSRHPPPSLSLSLSLSTVIKTALRQLSVQRKRQKRKSQTLPATLVGLPRAFSPLLTLLSLSLSLPGSLTRLAAPLAPRSPAIRRRASKPRPPAHPSRRHFDPALSSLHRFLFFFVSFLISRCVIRAVASSIWSVYAVGIGVSIVRSRSLVSNWVWNRVE